MRPQRSIVLAVVMGVGANACAQCEYGVGGFAIPIADMGTASYSLNGIGAGTVTSVKICFHITHGRQGDLVVRLAHEGITVTLLSRPGTEDGQSEVGYTAANFGSYPGGDFSLSDNAADAYAVPPYGNTPRPGTPGVYGIFKPTIDSLSRFVGTRMAGSWTLSVSDEAQGFTGTLNDISISINEILVGPCWTNCDGNTAGPALTASDFQCFLNEFAAGHSYANCDESTTPPVLNANDFQCFLNKFAAG